MSMMNKHLKKLFGFDRKHPKFKYHAFFDTFILEYGSKKRKGLSIYRSLKPFYRMRINSYQIGRGYHNNCNYINTRSSIHSNTYCLKSHSLIPTVKLRDEKY